MITSAPIPVTITNDGLTLSDWLNIAMFVVTLLSLFVAVCATRNSIRTARRSSKDAQEAAVRMKTIVSTSQATMSTVKDQLDRLDTMLATGTQIVGSLKAVATEFSRPRMNAFLGAPTHEKGYLPLVVENVGQSPARDVTVTFDPPLPNPDVAKLNANTASTVHYQKSLVAMTMAKYNGKTFKTWAPNQSTSVPFWATKTERLPEREVGESKRFINSDGSPGDAILIRVNTDGSVLLDESGDGVPADVEVIISYKDENETRYTERVSLNPNLWVSTTFGSTEYQRTSVTYGGNK